MSYANLMMELASIPKYDKDGKEVVNEQPKEVAGEELFLMLGGQKRT